MTTSFKQDIFGNLFQLQKRSSKTVNLPQNTLDNCLQNQISSTYHSNHSRCFQPQAEFAECLENPQQGQQHNLDFKISSQKQLSCSSTSIGNSKTAESFKQLKNIFTSLSFPCYSCQHSQIKNGQCETCSNTGIIRDNSKLVKVMQYIMEFKCGLIPSYKQQQEQKKKKIIHFKSQVILKSTPNWRTHEGYKCNGCQVEPIVGVRYHCPHPCCNDDYDLCQNCFCKLSHHHELQQLGYNLMQEKFESVKANLLKPCSKNSLSNRNICSSFEEKNKVF